MLSGGVQDVCRQHTAACHRTIAHPQHIRGWPCKRAVNQALAVSDETAGTAPTAAMSPKPTARKVPCSLLSSLPSSTLPACTPLPPNRIGHLQSEQSQMLHKQKHLQVWFGFWCMGMAPRRSNYCAVLHCSSAKHAAAIVVCDPPKHLPNKLSCVGAQEGHKSVTMTEIGFCITQACTETAEEWAILQFVEQTIIAPQDKGRANECRT